MMHFYLRYFKAVYIMLIIYQSKPDTEAFLTSVQSNVCYVV